MGARCEVAWRSRFAATGAPHPDTHRRGSSRGERRSPTPPDRGEEGPQRRPRDGCPDGWRSVLKAVPRAASEARCCADAGGLRRCRRSAPSAPGPSLARPGTHHAW
jgi:hypothetical protein